jgi:Cu2+-exporting ATPase
VSECTLCGLATPSPPHSDPEVDGAYCCRGCLEVARTLDDPAETDAETAVDDGPDPAAAEGAETFLDVEGMHCATCESFVESVSTDAEGVRAAEANYSTGTMRVVYDADETDPDDVATAATVYGYRAERTGRDRTADGDHVTLGRLLVGVLFGMLTMMWYLLFLYPIYLGVAPSSLPIDLSGPAGAYVFANAWLSATVVLGYTGYPLLRGAVVSLRVGEPNMDLLVAIAATTAYVYSTAAALLGSTEVYFDITVVVVLAVTVGDYYQERVRRRATERLTAIAEERADTARRRTADGTERVDRSALRGGDELVVREGERVPADGTVLEGSAAVDESLITGESVPVSKAPGDEVVGGGTVTDGGLVVRAAEGATSTADRLVETLWSVQSTAGSTQRLVDRVAAVFVPLVFLLAVATTAGHLFAGAGTTGTLLTGLTVLVVSCPCALGLATPLAVAAGVRDALAAGVVIASGDVLETAPDVDAVALDKTGTLTTGEMTVRSVVGDEDALGYAATVEQFGAHPVADAIVEAGTPREGAVEDVETRPGEGIAATVDGRRVVVGAASLFAARGWTVPEDLAERYDGAADGAVPSYVGWDGSVRGVVVVGDEFREGWERTVSRVAEDRRVVALTGDDAAAASPLSEHPGVDEVFAEVPPEAKSSVVERLRAEGTVAMVGDGSNDAPALAAADVGVAMERGTQLATDAADVVLTRDSLSALPTVFETTVGTRRRIRENLGWAFLYNAVAVPLAVAGALNPLFAAIAMATSSLLVVGNSTRAVASSGGQ